MKFENIDLVDALRRIMDIHTQNYKEDFELDAGLLHSLAGSQSPEDKHLLWMSRPNGTYLLPEREVYSYLPFSHSSANCFPISCAISGVTSPMSKD